MKTFYPNVVALFSLLAIFSTSYAQYDDIYYSPENDVTYSNEASFNNDLNTSQYDWTDEDEYAESGNDTYITNNYYGNDYFYSSRIKRFRRPVSRFGYYNNCYTNLYYYDYSPYSCGSSIYYGSYNSGWYTSSPFIVLNIGNNWCRPRYSYVNYNAFCSPNYYGVSYYNPYSFNNNWYGNNWYGNNWYGNNWYGGNNYGNNAYCGPGFNNGSNYGGGYYTPANGGPRTGRDRIIRNNGNTRSTISTAGQSTEIQSTGNQAVNGSVAGQSDDKFDRFNDQPIKNSSVKSVKDRYETDQPYWTIKDSKPTNTVVKDTKSVSDDVQTIKNPRIKGTPVKTVKPSNSPSIKVQKPRTDEPIKVKGPRSQSNTIKTQKPKSNSTYQKPRSGDRPSVKPRTTRPNTTIKAQKPRSTSKPKRPTYTKPKTSKPSYSKPRTSKPSYSKPRSSSGSKNRSTSTKSRSSSSSKGRR